MEKKRSKGIAIASWYLILSGIWIITMNLMRLWTVVIYCKDSNIPISKVTNILIGTILAIIILIISINAGFGLLRLKPSARRTALILSWIGFIMGLLTIITFFPMHIYHKLILITNGLIYIIFLTRPKVKEQFK